MEQGQNPVSLRWPAGFEDITVAQIAEVEAPAGPGTGTGPGSRTPSDRAWSEGVSHEEDGWDARHRNPNTVNLGEVLIPIVLGNLRNAGKKNFLKKNKIKKKN